jgi:DNA-binding CsgD family transcriptional regulator
MPAHNQAMASSRDRAPATAAGTSAGLSGSRSLLLERDREIDLLLRAWRDARAGHGSTWLICAEAGGGKTRLAAEVAARTGARALSGAAEPLTPPDPYLAVSAALPGFVPAATRAESVTRALDLLDRTAGGRPVLCILDDLHFADEGTVAVMLRLSAACAGRPWLILCAFRPGEGVTALHTAATELVAQGRARRLDLAPLSRNAVGALVADLRGGDVDVRELDAIAADSGGNPWFVKALANGPDSVTTMRGRMLLRLHQVEAMVPGATDVLEALAPATRAVPHIVLTTLCAGRVPGLRRVLAGLRDRSLLDETDNGWAYRHELIRRAVLDSMVTAEREEAHRTLAETLEACGTPAEAGSQAPGLIATARSWRPTAAELAMHYAAARDQRAVSWAMQAAEDARAVDAHAEALAQAERALTFDLDPNTRRAALKRAGEDAAVIGRYTLATQYSEAALAVPGAGPEETAYLHWMAARTLPGAAGDAHLLAAETVLDGLPPGPILGRVLAARASRALEMLETEYATQLAHRALALVRGITHEETAQVEFNTRRTLVGAGGLRAEPDWPGESTALVRFASDRGLPARFALAALVEGYQLAVLSRMPDEADRLYRRAVTEIQRIGADWSAIVEPFRALDLTLRGDYATARAAAAACPPPNSGAFGVAVLRAAELLCEARAGSCDRAQELLRAWPEPDTAHARVFHNLVALELATANGTADDATSLRDVYDAMSHHQFAYAAGTATVAVARLDSWAPPAPAWLASTSPMRVFWHWAAGIVTNDSALIRAAAEQLERLAMPYEAALALADAGDVGDAYRAFGEIGAGEARRRLAGRLRAAGRPVPRRTRAEVERDGLTHAERAVVRLVAGGASNEQVAEQLGISVRTVHSHLGRIYRRTGQRGRVALATWWTEHQRQGAAG